MVRHERRTPWRHGLRFRTYQWLVDIDALPHIPGIVSFPVRDHFGGNAPTMRAAVERFAATQGEDVRAGDRVLMLAAGRSAGRAFDPLTVYWCLDPSDAVRWAVLEIHNTYGERHAHLVHLDETGSARITKEFYVSPFFEVEGEYQMRLQLHPERLAVSLRLVRDSATVFTASFAGDVRPASAWNVLRAVVRTPLATWQTVVRIRIHGIWLWLRRLPVISRPVHDTQAGLR